MQAAASASTALCLPAAPRPQTTTTTLACPDSSWFPPPHRPLRYGFIVMDGNGSLFGTLCGNNREILHKVGCNGF